MSGKMNLTGLHSAMTPASSLRGSMTGFARVTKSDSERGTSLIGREVVKKFFKIHLMTSGL